MADRMTGFAGVSYRFLRALRTGALQLAGPVEATVRRLRSAPALPPLWLRRHSGKVALFESAALDTARLIREANFVRPDDLVLDLGCGPGAMAPHIATMLGPRGRYCGIDVHARSVQWCRKQLGEDRRFEFLVAEIATPYSERRFAPPTSYRFPLEDATVGFALAKSLFTHLLPAEAQHYLHELRRVLIPGRYLFLTAFLFEPGSVPAFRYGDEADGVRWRRSGRPHAGIAYEKRRFLHMIAEARLRVSDFGAIFYPGRRRELLGQDIIVLERA
jgi:SAM-dependent methyltransferase